MAVPESRIAAVRHLLAGVAAFWLVAATLPLSTLEDLVRQADVIVHVRVEDVRPGPANKNSFQTTILLSVTEQWKGAVLTTFTLSQPGGAGGSIAEAVPGLPTFRAGEELILFLQHNGQGSYEVLNGKQGKLVIHEDHSGGTLVVEDATGEIFALSEMRRTLNELTQSPSTSP